LFLKVKNNSIELNSISRFSHQHDTLPNTVGIRDTRMPRARVVSGKWTALGLQFVVGGQWQVPPVNHHETTKTAQKMTGLSVASSIKKVLPLSHEII